MRKSVFLPAIISTVLAGCAVGTDYAMPSLGLPMHWLGLGDRSLDASEAPVGSLAWWQTFEDPTLNRLIDSAISRNGDLRVALARLTEARANRLAANAALLPEINGASSIGRGNVTTSGGVQTASTAEFDASWEIDLFGGNRRAAEAARAGVASAEAARKQVRVSLLAEVVRNYLNVRQLQEQVELTRRNLETQDETLRIVNAQYREGVASGLDVARAQGQVATTRAQLPAVEQDLTASINNLGVLVGQQPSEIVQALEPTVKVPVSTPTVLVATPATVLAQRPDVRVAERDLAAATANQGVALSNWFPRISLTALFGLSGGNSFNNSDEIWQAGGAVTLPIIDFGRVRALVRTANARQEAALASYEQAVLSALADVETSLKGYVNAQRRLGDLQTAADANARAVTLAQARYREGVVPLLDVLTAQQQQLAAESNLAAGKAAVGQAYATLYKALGGGIEDASTTTQPAPAATETDADRG